MWGELFVLPSHLSASCKSINPEIWSGLVIKCAWRVAHLFKVETLPWLSFYLIISSLPGSQHPLNAFCSAAGPEMTASSFLGLAGAEMRMWMVEVQVVRAHFCHFWLILVPWAAETLQSNK